MDITVRVVTFEGPSITHQKRVESEIGRLNKNAQDPEAVLL